MKHLMQLKMPQGLPFVRIKVSEQAFRLIKTRLQAVGQEDKLFASSFTIGTLVEKLELTAQSRRRQRSAARSSKRSRAAVSALTGTTHQTYVACRGCFHTERKTGPSFAEDTTMAVIMGQNPNTASQCPITENPQEKS